MHTFLCVHGIGGTRADWAGVTGPLERLGRVVCVDVPAGSMERGRDAIIDELERGAGPAIVVGHSRGGVLALMAAAERPALVERLVLSGGYVPPTRADRSWVIGGGSWVKHRARLAGRFVRGGHLTTRRSATPASLRTSLPSVMGIAGMGLRPSAFDRIARAVRCPVLAVSGERDSHVPSSWVGATARRYGWSHVTLPGGSHFAHIETPDAWAALVADWLAR
jgi:pimeloyl-ACP methyl ester carboxylesterase